jgi:hypothetical protein
VKSPPSRSKCVRIVLCLFGACCGFQSFGASIKFLEDRATVSTLVDFTFADGSIQSFEATKEDRTPDRPRVFDAYNYNYEAYVSDVFIIPQGLFASSKISHWHDSGGVLYVEGQVDPETVGDRVDGPTIPGLVADVNLMAFASVYWEFVVQGHGISLSSAYLVTYEPPLPNGAYLRLFDESRGLTLFDLNPPSPAGGVSSQRDHIVLSPGRYRLEGFTSAVGGGGDENAFEFTFQGVDRIRRVPDGGASLVLLGVSVASMLGFRRLTLRS